VHHYNSNLTRDLKNWKQCYYCCSEGRLLDVTPHAIYTDMRRLTTGELSEKCVVSRFRRCANVIECTYTDLDRMAYYTPRLYGIGYCS
jgi:hypothetical protein